MLQANENALNAPVLRYLKEPVWFLNQLYTLYPNGGILGCYAFVHEIGGFAYWDVNLSIWRPLSTAVADANLITDYLNVSNRPQANLSVYEADDAIRGMVYQHVGDTDDDFIKGCFYTTSYSSELQAYEWVAVAIQDVDYETIQNRPQRDLTLLMVDKTMIGRIYQHVGQTTESLTRGYFYEARNDGWHSIGVQKVEMPEIPNVVVTRTDPTLSAVGGLAAGVVLAGKTVLEVLDMILWLPPVSPTPNPEPEVIRSFDKSFDGSFG